MAKRKNSSRHGHSGDPRKRAAEEQARAQAEATPELEDEVGAALEAGHPIDIVMLASSLIAGLDPDGRAPADEATDRLPQPEEFVRMFLDSSDPRLHVLAWTVARLLPDSRLHHAVDAALDPGTVPAWLLPLADAEVVAAWQTTDPLRDSTDIVVSLRLGETDLTVIGLVDFNSDGALKDGFVVPAPLTAVQEALSASGETGMEAWELAPADARTWLVDAIAVGRVRRAAVRVRQLAAGPTAGGVGAAAVSARGAGPGAPGVEPRGRREGGRRVRGRTGGCGGRRPGGSGRARRRSPRPRPRHVRGPGS